MKTLKLTTVMILLLAVTFACSSDDSTPEPQTETFRIKPVSLRGAKFPSTEGEFLEVYGTISTSLLTRTGFLEEKILWSRSRDFFEQVGNDEILINSEGIEHIYTINEEDLEDRRIKITISMYDHDPDGHDDFLGEYNSISYVDTMIVIPDNYSSEPLFFPITDFDGVELMVGVIVEHIRE